MTKWLMSLSFALAMNLASSGVARADVFKNLKKGAHKAADISRTVSRGINRAAKVTEQGARGMGRSGKNVAKVAGATDKGSDQAGTASKKMGDATK